MLVKNECLAVVINGFTRFSWKRFNIVIDILCGVGGFIETERNILVWHDVNVDKDIVVC